MKHRRIISAAVAALALVALTGCGSSSGAISSNAASQVASTVVSAGAGLAGSQTAAAPVSSDNPLVTDFTGSWDAVAVSTSDKSDLVDIADTGYAAHLTVNADGTGTYDLDSPEYPEHISFSVTYEQTGEPKAYDEGVFTNYVVMVDGQAISGITSIYQGTTPCIFLAIPEVLGGRTLLLVQL